LGSSGVNLHGLSFVSNFESSELLDLPGIISSAYVRVKPVFGGWQCPRRFSIIARLA